MPKFHAELFRGKDKQYYLRIRASNGKILMVSEGYRRKRGARDLYWHLIGGTMPLKDLVEMERRAYSPPSRRPRATRKTVTDGATIY